MVSSGWSFIRVVFQQVSLWGLSFIRMVFHQCGFSSLWSLGGLSSGWSFIRSSTEYQRKDLTIWIPSSGYWERPVQHAIFQKGDLVQYNQFTLLCTVGWDFLGCSWFQSSDIFQKAIKMALGSILSVNSHLSGFKLEPGLTHKMVM